MRAQLWARPGAGIALGTQLCGACVTQGRCSSTPAHLAPCKTGEPHRADVWRARRLRTRLLLVVLRLPCAERQTKPCSIGRHVPFCPRPARAPGLADGLALRAQPTWNEAPVPSHAPCLRTWCPRLRPCLRWPLVVLLRDRQRSLDLCRCWGRGAFLVHRLKLRARWGKPDWPWPGDCVAWGAKWPRENPDALRGEVPFHSSTSCEHCASASVGMTCTKPVPLSALSPVLLPHSPAPHAC